MKTLKYTLIACAAVLFLAACGSGFGLSVDEFIDQNNLVTEELEEGVHIIIHEEGVGEKPFLDTPVTIKYTGMLTDSTIFDSSESRTFLLRQLIRGWQIGIRELGVGGKATLIIPYEAGYGDQDVNIIPGGSTLIFEVELLDINQEVASTIEEYIAENNLTTKELDKGVHIIIKEPGSNEKPTLANDVKVNYRGTLLNGIQFDAGTSVEFPLANLIEGWQIGIPELGKGGSATLIIPPAVGYGSTGSGTIPPNAILLFDIDLIDFK